MNYYHIRVYTPYCGEEADVYIAAETVAEYHARAHQAALENGMEWYDEEEWLESWGFDREEEDAEDICDEYYAECGWHFMKMICEGRYQKLKEEGEWCI